MRIKDCLAYKLNPKAVEGYVRGYLIFEAETSEAYENMPQTFYDHMEGHSKELEAAIRKYDRKVVLLEAATIKEIM